MKLACYSIGGRIHYGVVSDRGLHDLSSRLPDCPDIKCYIEGGAPSVELSSTPDHALDAVQFLPVVPNPGKIICIGLNYQAHKQEGVRHPDDKPMLFGRWPETLIGHQAPLLIPKVSSKLDFEAELITIIGKRTGRYVSVEKALEYVFGYSCMNEGSVRDWQRHSSQVTAGKNFVGTGAVGPYLVTAEEVGNPQALALELTVNGTKMQKANTVDMIWTVAEMISYITNWIPLNPGDMIATGTPEGVGSRRVPPVFLQPGDVVEVTIEKLGTLSNVVVKEN